ncbi:MFS transporter [Candidatus Palauibacter sp.]|uniref:MFS transporter n=1 Tax=Candidatus Palauibacter sp. TaxID=3101350 RepID=UPI003AF1FC01
MSGPQAPVIGTGSEPTLHEPSAALANPSAGVAPRFNLRPGAVVALIVVSHTTIDAYTAFLPPLLPRIMDGFGLSIALAATLSTALSIATALPQPAFGYLADRFGRRAFLAAGPIVAGVFLSLMGMAPSYLILVLLLVVGGLGSAAFHPPGASLVARAGDGRGSGVRMSVFSFGGAAGFALGPISAVAIVGLLGLPGLWVAMIPGVLFGIALWFGVKGRTRVGPGTPPPPPMEVIRMLKGPLGLVFGISVVGSFAQKAILTFIPIIAHRAGVSETAGAVVLSVYLGAQGLGTLTSGFLTDRLNRQHLLTVVSVLAVPAHILALTLAPASSAAIVMAVCAGFLNMALLPPIVVMAQEILPSGTAASSGIVMGLAWAVGTLGIPVVGGFADAFGPVAAAAWSMPLLLLGALFAMRPSLRAYSHAR